jgi:hypothetical protein
LHVLLGKSRSVRNRIVAIIFSTVSVTLTGILFAALGAAAGLWDWPPRPSSPFGVLCGFAAGIIVVFEMLLLPRKLLRGQRLGTTRTWMRWHIWLGLICLPVVLVHAGFGSGGPLPTVTLILFLAVTFSGIWGLIMQQWLPQKILSEMPGETVASQVNYLGDYHANEAKKLIQGLVSAPPEAESIQPVVTGMPATSLVEFQDSLLLPYLHWGTESHLGSRAEAEQRFAQLRSEIPVVAHSTLDRLQELVNLRRQWDAQTRLNFWLHNWLLLHLPLSVAMTGLMFLHAVRALKYW